MAGAILVGLLAFSIARGRSASLLGESMQLPASLSSGGQKPLTFVLAMLAGMALYEVQGWLAARRTRAPG